MSEELLVNKSIDNSSMSCSTRCASGMIYGLSQEEIGVVKGK